MDLGLHRSLRAAEDPTLLGAAEGRAAEGRFEARAGALGGGLWWKGSGERQKGVFWGF